MRFLLILGKKVFLILKRGRCLMNLSSKNKFVQFDQKYIDAPDDYYENNGGVYSCYRQMIILCNVVSTDLPVW